ncbi:MAG: hypothetical protein IT385_13875 [Deltaproteobacteria bacterium]|nr:hypothetical protein [Deltaproteobacteria bacterium]
MRTITAILVASSLIACGKADPAKPAPTAPATSTSAPTTPPPTAALELAERKADLVFEGKATLARVTVTVQAPKAWVFLAPAGQAPMDGRNGHWIVTPNATDDDGPGLIIMATGCDREPCTTEAHDKQRMELKSSDSMKVLSNEITAPGVAVSVSEHKGKRSAMVSRILTGATPLYLECVAEPAGDLALLDVLLDACKKLTAEAPVALPSGEQLQAEQARLASCPPATTVTFTGDKLPAFGEVKQAGAFQARARVLHLRLANAEGANLIDGPGDNTLRLDVSLLAPEGHEVTSGEYGRAEPPVIASAKLVGVSAPPAGDGSVAVVEPEEDEGLTFQGAESKVEVIARTSDKICGRFRLVAEGREARGEFNLALEVGKGPLE